MPIVIIYFLQDQPPLLLRERTQSNILQGYVLNKETLSAFASTA